MPYSTHTHVGIEQFEAVEHCNFQPGSQYLRLKAFADVPLCPTGKLPAIHCRGKSKVDCDETRHSSQALEVMSGYILYLRQVIQFVAGTRDRKEVVLRSRHPFVQRGGLHMPKVWKLVCKKLLDVLQIPDGQAEGLTHCWC